MRREVHDVPVEGVDVDPETRCSHYDGDRDVVAIRFPCCDTFYPCFECHREVTDHPAEVWPRGSFDRRAVLCGACGERIRIADYLAGPTACPACSTPFNPGCVDHHHLYFERDPGEENYGGSRTGSTMDEDVDYEAWSPYVVRDVSSPAVTAAPGDSDEEVRSLAGPGLSYVPIPEADEYYDLAAGRRRSLHPGQVVPPDRPLLAAVEALVEHPFLLVTGDDPDSGEPDYRIVTPADLNRRTAEAAFYPVLSTLAERLGDLIADEYPDSEDLVPLVGPFPVGSWTKARANDVDVHIADFLSLTDMIGVLKGNDRLLSALGYDDPDELESDLYAISDLRNRVMHGNRPLVLDREDVGTDVERLHTAIDLIRRVDRKGGTDRPSGGPP